MTSSANRRAALLYMLGSAAAFSTMSAIVKALGSRFSTAELLFARTIVSLILSYAWLRAQGVSPWGNDKGRLLLRGLVGFCGLSCMFYALPRAPLAEVTVIQYLYPLFTALLAGLLLGERLNLRFWAGSLVCLLGVLLVARPRALFGSVEALPSAGLWAALGSAWFSACAYVLVRKLSKSEHPLVIVFYFPLVALPATLPFVLVDFAMPHGWDWFWLVMIGVTTQFGQVWLTKALSLVEASQATSMAYSQVLFAVVWGVLLFAEWPSAFVLLGGACIVLGTWAIQYQREVVGRRAV